MPIPMEQAAADLRASMDPQNRPAKIRDLEDLYQIVTHLRLMIAVLERRLDQLDGGSKSQQVEIEL